jgi:hypothetical protein
VAKDRKSHTGRALAKALRKRGDTESQDTTNVPAAVRSARSGQA